MSQACYTKAKIARVDVIPNKASAAFVALVCAADTAGATRATAVVASMEFKGEATFVLQQTSAVTLRLSRRLKPSSRW